MRKILYIIFTCLAPLYGASQMMMANTYDLDAFAFMQRGSYNQVNVAIRNNGQLAYQGGMYMGAIHQIVCDYKRTNLWDTFPAIYLLTSGPDAWGLGGATAATVESVAYTRARFNLKGTSYTLLIASNRWADARNDGYWFGSSSPDGTGSLFQQTAFNTGVPQNIFGSFNSMSLSVYVMNRDSTNSSFEMGAYNTATNLQVGLISTKSNYGNVANRYAGALGFDAPFTADIKVQDVNRDPRGLNSIIRRANNALEYNQNGVPLATNTVTQTTNTLQAFPFYLGAFHSFNNTTSLGASGFSRKTIGYADIGRGISQVGALRKYEIVNRYFQNINRPTF